MTSIEIPLHAVRLRNTSARSPFAMTGLPAAIFGGVFVCAGIAISTRTYAAGLHGLHAPRGILALGGAILALLGLHVAINGLADVRRRRIVAERAAAMPGLPWFWDHDWPRDGIGNDTAREIARSSGYALFIAIFLIPFHWFAFFSPNGLRIFAIGVVLFDIIIAGLLLRAARLALMRRRYGPSRLRFKRFPFHPGEKLDVSLEGTGGLSAMSRLTGTLRCVQERYETHGSGKNQRTTVVCYALWSATVVADRNGKGGFDFTFDVPDGVPSSALSERPARYWEIAVASDDVPGVDYSANFLVPVYGTASVQSPTSKVQRPTAIDHDCRQL